MHKLLKTSLLAGIAAIGSATGVAHADNATTGGGIKIRTDDGKFEFGIGGRLHLDTVIFDDDKLTKAGLGPNGQTPAAGTSPGTVSDTYLRRAYLTLTGRLYDFTFKFENDFGIASPAGIREMWMAHEVFGGQLIVGQHKPFRVMEELLSSNELGLMERPFVTNVLFASGTNRQFQPGVFYKLPIETENFGHILAQASIYNANHALGTTPGQGFGTAERISWLAYSTDDLKAYVGVSGGLDNFSKVASGNQSVNYAGRNSQSVQVVGPTQLIAPSIIGGNESWIGAELAGEYKSAYLQSEWMRATYEDARGPGKSDSLVSWYVQGSYFLTGESKPYQKSRGSFGSPKVNKPLGAVELVGRYDSVHNTDRVASAGSGVCQANAAVVQAGAQCKATQWSAGVNYYFNPLVRVMFNYVNGTSKVTDDNTASYNLRLQLAF